MELASIIVILFIISPNFECVQNDYKHYKLYDINGNIGRLQIGDILQQHSESIINLNSDINGLQVLVEPRTVPFFKHLVEERRLNVTLLSDDVSEIIRVEKGRKKRQFSWTAYYDVNEIYQFLTNISKAHPTWSEVIVAGKSYEGRKILGIRINTPVEGKQSPKPVFFIESGIHAREWIAPATTTYFINQLLTSSDPNITRLRDQFDWRIFPSVNPDGYQYSYRFDRYWRKTRSISANGCIGADPNRNWDYNWGQHSTSSNPCDYQLYAGSKPFSEVETRTLSEYISKIDNLLFYVAFHSYASVLLIPYSDSTEHVSNYDDLVEVGKTSIEYGRRVANSEYSGPAPAAEVLYKASGGSMDWVRHALNIPLVYTYELRGRSFHWPPSRISEQGDEVTQMMLGLATGASNLGYF